MADEADHAQTISDIHLAAALRQHRTQRGAAEPSDGICRNCGEPIAPARLVALPTGRLCIACASKT